MWVLFKNTKLCILNIGPWLYIWDSTHVDKGTGRGNNLLHSCDRSTKQCGCRTDSVYPVYSPPTGTTAISLEGSGPVIVMTSKALGGPHSDTNTHIWRESERQETAGARKCYYLKQFDRSSQSTCSATRAHTLRLNWPRGACRAFTHTFIYKINLWNAFFHVTNANYLHLRHLHRQTYPVMTHFATNTTYT